MIDLSHLLCWFILKGHTLPLRDYKIFVSFIFSYVSWVSYVSFMSSLTLLCGKQIIRSIPSRESEPIGRPIAYTRSTSIALGALLLYRLFPYTLYNANAIAMRRNESGYNQRSVTKWYIGVTGMTMRLGANRVGTIISRERDKARVKGGRFVGERG